MALWQPKASVDYFNDASSTNVIDSTHGLNAQGYQLYTVQSWTGNWTGIPLCSFLVPSDHDEAHIRAALEYIREQVSALSAGDASMKTFLWMCDDAPVGKACTVIISAGLRASNSSMVPVYFVEEINS